MKKMSSDN